MEETITTEANSPVPEPEGVILTHQALYFLNESAGWGKFLSIMGFILCGLMILGSFFAGSLFTTFGRFSPNPAATPMPAFAGFVIGIFYFLIGLVYFFPSYYLYKFSVAAKRGVAHFDSEEITFSMEKLKSCLKFWGILTIVILCFYALMLVGLVVGLFAASHIH